MTGHTKTQTRMQAASVLPPCPFTAAELRSELLSVERHLRLLHQQRRTLQRQLTGQ